MVEAHHHRSTLKQKNKPFKSKHATKSALKDQAKGRFERQSPKNSHLNNTSASQLRVNRRNAAKQAQVKNRLALLASTRMFNGVDGTPRIVAVIPLTPDVNAREVSSTLATAIDVDIHGIPDYGLWKLKADRFKTSIQFVHVPYRSFYSALDACKVADYVLFVLSSSTEVDSWGEVLLRSLQAQGLPSVVSVIPPSRSEPSDVKSRAGVLKSLLSFIQYFVPTQSRVFDLASTSDSVNALRSICEGRPADVRWREGRNWLLAEDIQWDADDRGETGKLRVTGVIRGGVPFSVNRLVHLLNYGDFQVEKVLSAPLSRSRAPKNEMDVEPVTLADADPADADSLISTNAPDDLANEQTWPTEEEMQGDVDRGVEEDIPDANVGTTPRRIRRVPKGMSEYQAAWIIDDEDGDEEGAGTDRDTGVSDQIDAGAVSIDMDEDVRDDEKTSTASDREEMEDLALNERVTRNVTFQDLDMEEETRQLQEWRGRSRTDDEKEDATFPDEIDTPQDIPARVRFARFRGLRSFRTSPWDPYENLPRDYARIFQFEDFKRTERAVRRRAEEAEEGTVQPGIRVTLTLSGVPEEASRHDLRHPFVLVGVLQHEHKKSVVNFKVQRNTEFEESIRSKDAMVLCYGYRRLKTNPIYSQHTRGGGKGANNIHKFERWFRHGSAVIATTYGPIAFGNQPCYLLKETDDTEAPNLVAMGTFIDCDTTRIIAKRVILTGHPFKVHKKTATVRYMFFNREDVMYFKPIQLHTKYGRTGHIRESLGTHGYFKAHFDGPINQMDTVCMSLYKRVYPRWTEEWKTPYTPPIPVEHNDTNGEDQLMDVA